MQTMYTYRWSGYTKRVCCKTHFSEDNGWLVIYGASLWTHIKCILRLKRWWTLVNFYLNQQITCSGISNKKDRQSQGFFNFHESVFDLCYAM